MSRFYGTIGGDGHAKEQNRCANGRTFAAARTHAGSVIVHVWGAGNGGELKASIESGEGSQATGRTLWTGKLADLVNAESITVNPREAS